MEALSKGALSIFNDKGQPKESVMTSDQDYHAETALIHKGSNRSEWGETSEAMFMTSGYVYGSAEQAEARFAGDESEKGQNIYSRYANPTVSNLLERACAMEGCGGARATATGMAAVATSLLAIVEAGDRVVASRALFGSCRWICVELLPRYSVEVVIVDGGKLDEWEKALSKPTKAILIETPSNPLLEAVDIKAVADMGHKVGAKLIVDNVFATPILQKPFEYGADVVVYSATKHIDGQGRALGGLILTRSEEEMEETYEQFLRHTGPSISPFNAWVMLKGMETLALRVEKHTSNAAELADFIAEIKGVDEVRYPFREDHPHFKTHKKQMSGGSSLVSFHLTGGKNAAFEFENALRLIKISNNLGDAKSLITHPWTTTHKAIPEEERVLVGLDEGWLRLSVGLEHIGDLKSDLERAANAAF